MNKDYLAIWQSKEYQDRVLQLEQEGCTTSDAQGIADVELKLCPNCKRVSNNVWDNCCIYC